LEEEVSIKVSGIYNHLFLLFLALRRLLLSAFLCALAATHLFTLENDKTNLIDILYQTAAIICFF